MTNTKLSEKDREMYLNIKVRGNIDDMFDFGFSLGRVHQASEALKIAKSAFEAV